MGMRSHAVEYDRMQKQKHIQIHTHTQNQKHN